MKKVWTTFAIGHPLTKYDREKFLRRFVNLRHQFLVGAKTLSIMTLSIMTFSIITFIIMNFSIMTFSIITFSIMTLSIMTFSIMTFSIITLGNCDIDFYNFRHRKVRNFKISN
jgi:hypothetical protein